MNIISPIQFANLSNTDSLNIELLSIMNIFREAFIAGIMIYEAWKTENFVNGSDATAEISVLE